MRGSISADSTRSALLKAYPQSREILETEYTGLESSAQRQALYVHKGNLSFVFENPVYGGEKDSHQQGLTKKSKTSKTGSNFGRKDFLSAIPSFRGFTDEQLNILEKGAVEKRFKNGVRSSLILSSFLSSLFALRSSLFALRSSLFALRSSLFALRSSLFALRSSLCTLHSSSLLYILSLHF
jgi:hypothetical protein